MDVTMIRNTRNAIRALELSRSELEHAESGY